MKNAPAALWAYAVLSLGFAIPSFAMLISRHPAATLGASAIVLALTLLLLRGSRVVWSFFTAVVAVSLLTTPFAPLPWWSIALNVLSLGLLLAPASRRYVWRPRPRVAADTGQSTWDPEGGADVGRPSGWYVDPSIPTQMRYWNANEAQWMGTTKTPRKIRKAWVAQQAD